MVLEFLCGTTHQLVVFSSRHLHGRRDGSMDVHLKTLSIIIGLSAHLSQLRIRHVTRVLFLARKHPFHSMDRCISYSIRSLLYYKIRK